MVRAVAVVVSIRTATDPFSGARIYPGKGKLFVRSDNKSFRFVNGKTESLFLQKKSPRLIGWTTLYRHKHKKGLGETELKRRKRRTIKQQRAIVGAPLEVLKERRQPGDHRRKPGAPSTAAISDVKQRKREEAKKKVVGGAPQPKGLTNREMQGRGKQTGPRPGPAKAKR